MHRGAGCAVWQVSAWFDLCLQNSVPWKEWQGAPHQNPGQAPPIPAPLSPWRPTRWLTLAWRMPSTFSPHLLALEARGATELQMLPRTSPARTHRERRKGRCEECGLDRCRHGGSAPRAA